MNIQDITDFFMWCALINGGLLLLWTTFILFAPDLVYRIQTRFIEIDRDSFNTLMYAFLGLFKIFFLVFNLVPYLALVIVNLA